MPRKGHYDGTLSWSGGLSDQHFQHDAHDWDHKEFENFVNEYTTRQQEADGVAAA